MSLKSSLKTVLTLGQGLAGGLPDAAADADPIDLFHVWFEAASESGLLLPEAMSLATATPEGVPSVRMVLLKQADQDGFVFFTNYGSQKAAELDANPRAALCFHWAVLPTREELEARVREIEAEYPDDVPLPPFWGGYRVVPERIEFWQGRADRLHDRLRFQRQGSTWTSLRLYP
jgi:pyridoxamine 5'-phosphate oxidase